MRVILLYVAILATAAEAFQFMKGWKLPTYDPNEEVSQQKFGDKSTYDSDGSTFSPIASELAVITGASSGLGRKTAQALLRTGDYHVIGAVREYVNGTNACS